MAKMVLTDTDRARVANARRIVAEYNTSRFGNIARYRNAVRLLAEYGIGV